VVFSLVTVAFHEYIHANVARLFGGDAYVRYYFFSGYTIISNLSGWPLALVALSGGIGCFLLFLYFFVWWLEEEPDRYVRLPCFYFMINQLTYGILEGGIFLGLPISFALAGIISMVAGFWATIVYILEWW